MTLPASKPGLQEIEVSIFSRGYGESICIHVGQGKWLIIDSLLTSSGQPVALEYLISLGCDLQSDVVAILITHWHDDHIGGAASLIAQCSSAIIALSGVLLEDEFITLLQRADPPSTSTISSGIDELVQVLSLIKHRDSMFCWHNQIIAEDRSTFPFRFESLSPSSGDFVDFMESIRNYVLSDEPGRRIISPPRNDASVAAVVEIQADKLLFGADLETSKLSTGWDALNRAAWRNRGQACFFKIPHHGSVTGHHPLTWTDLLLSDVTSGLTPWSRGRKLPSNTDVDRILRYTSNAHIASRVRVGKSKKRDQRVEQTLTKFGIQVEGGDQTLGHLRFRKLLTSKWQVEYGGDSSKLSHMIPPGA
ncbi:MBL fold metallo-hydrolase [Lichenifustis flavocetrariae]|uniref:MBL fold metallo-hydrolase n=1 Tax=Lichenifustis flavocetrariae TaxID=2949735 RepID=A0AA42CLI0_9HYPH|nr:MBL fold metallo-hydrolase [Lichenifustis flavocetrariae]MCW6507397.1 MBL fold metallo-hydrolase [Lichenifustis flavocetrariae]